MQKKITILALHLGYGGIERYLSLFCKMFENKYDIEIIATYKFNEKPPYTFGDKVKIKYLVTDNLQDASIKKLLKEKKFISIIKELIRRRKISHEAKTKNIKELKKVNCDYIITTRTYHNKLVNKYLRKSQIIKIATEHNYHNNDKKYINAFIKSVSYFDYVVHCTKELYDFYSSKIIGPKNLLIDNAIDLKEKEIAKLQNKNIISVGRLSPEKGFFDLIDVMEKIHEKDSSIKLTICGDGYQRKEIEDYILAKRLNKIIKLTGFIKGEELNKKYLNSSLYVMTSKSESFGLVLLEAMQFGLPCIAFADASGPRYLLSNDVGVLIEERNIDKMAEKIISMLNDPKLLQKYQTKGLKKVKDFSLDKISEKWEKEIFNNQ